MVILIAFFVGTYAAMEGSGMYYTMAFLVALLMVIQCCTFWIYKNVRGTSCPSARLHALA